MIQEVRGGKAPMNMPPQENHGWQLASPHDLEKFDIHYLLFEVYVVNYSEDQKN